MGNKLIPLLYNKNINFQIQYNIVYLHKGADDDDDVKCKCLA